MKTYRSIFAAAFFLLCTLSLKAQTSGADYFAGKWNILLKGTPNGDVKMFFVLDKQDTTVAGIVQDSTGTQISKIDKVELSGTTLTVYFNTQGYDINIVMNKKDDDHVTGSLMNMFDVEGERVKAK